MKQLTALDLHYLLKELQEFIGGKVDQIYSPSKKELVLQFHIPGIGKRILIVRVPGLIWVSDTKPQSDKLSDFCKTLRKHLGNSRLRKIKQIGFERIIEFIFEKKEMYSLIFEMFSKGNILLVKNKKIIAAVEYQKWAGRTLRPREEYNWPKKEYNFLELKLNDLKNLFLETKKESAVKSLAIELGLGGNYAEDVCSIAGVDKNKKPDTLNASEIKKLFGTFSDLKKKKVGRVILSRFMPEKEMSPGERKYLKKVEEIGRIISEQKQKIKGLENSEKENKKKAELLYEKYNLVKEIIAQIKKARKKYSWKEIKDKLKAHKLIKEINEKEKTIVLELK
ncbi:NFACT family protein [Candidatus Woesearchaeota archaeon]|nr:NFACT family protein [Candidatus Woesearchaeota archaeon]